MGEVGEVERKTQDRVVREFRQQLGYDYLGNWAQRAHNANVEFERLAKNLRARGYDDPLIGKAIHRLRSDASLGGGRDLYEANREVHDLLRYGVKVRPGVGEQTETVWLIDWANPEANHFAVAEEVTVLGQHTKRPDLVLYVDGIALVTLELKRSTDRQPETSPANRSTGRCGSSARSSACSSSSTTSRSSTPGSGNPPGTTSSSE